MTLRLLTLGCALLTAGSTWATTTTTFGPFPGATFGGSGNPTDPVMVTEIIEGSDTIVLGLAAQQRYFNPPLTHDGNGTYFATPGQNNGLGSSSYQGATWNFDYYISSTSADYTYKLWMGTDLLSLSFIDPLGVGDNKLTGAFGGQNSQNLLFPAWGNLSGFEPNPLFLSFDPNANADYHFILEAFNQAGGSVGSSAITVRVGTGSASVPDGGTTSVLLGAALGAMALIRRKLAA